MAESSLQVRALCFCYSPRLLLFPSPLNQKLGWSRSCLCGIRRLTFCLSLQDRLRDHAKAFDGLLSLIPAKMYYGEDTSVRLPLNTLFRVGAFSPHTIRRCDLKEGKKETP
jgi:hypothetical protein